MPCVCQNDALYLDRDWSWLEKRKTGVLKLFPTRLLNGHRGSGGQDKYLFWHPIPVKHTTYLVNTSRQSYAS